MSIWESIHVFIPTLQCQQTRRYTQHLDFSHNSESDRAALFNHTHILKVWSSKKTETIYEHHKGVWEISPCCGLYVSCVQCLFYMLNLKHFLNWYACASSVGFSSKVPFFLFLPASFPLINFRNWDIHYIVSRSGWPV